MSRLDGEGQERPVPDDGLLPAASGHDVVPPAETIGRRQPPPPPPGGVDWRMAGVGPGEAWPPRRLPPPLPGPLSRDAPSSAAAPAGRRVGFVQRGPRGSSSATFPAGRVRSRSFWRAVADGPTAVAAATAETRCQPARRRPVGLGHRRDHRSRLRGGHRSEKPAGCCVAVHLPPAVGRRGGGERRRRGSGGQGRPGGRRCQHDARFQQRGGGGNRHGHHTIGRGADQQPRRGRRDQRHRPDQRQWPDLYGQSARD